MEAIQEHLLTRHEAAAFSGVSLNTINKVGEQRVAKPVRVGRSTFILAEETAAISLLSAIAIPLPINLKRQIRNWVIKSRPAAGDVYELSEALTVQMTSSAADAREAARAYAEMRDRWIEIDPAKMTGAPVIRGTRVPVRTLATRLESDESREYILEDYPHVPPAAFDVAVTWAKANPPRGRPTRTKTHT